MEILLFAHNLKELCPGAAAPAPAAPGRGAAQNVCITLHYIMGKQNVHLPNGILARFPAENSGINKKFINQMTAGEYTDNIDLCALLGEER